MRGQTLSDCGRGESGGVMRGMARGSVEGFVSCLLKGNASARLVGRDSASMKDCHSDSKVM